MGGARWGSCPLGDHFLKLIERRNMTEKDLLPKQKKIRLAVIVADFGHAAHIPGAHVETTVKAFDLAPEIVQYIAKNQGQWSTISLALEMSDDE